MLNNFIKIENKYKFINKFNAIATFEYFDLFDSDRFEEPMSFILRMKPLDQSIWEYANILKLSLIVKRIYNDEQKYKNGKLIKIEYYTTKNIKKKFF
jgi:hypothetical protein